MKPTKQLTVNGRTVLLREPESYAVMVGKLIKAIRVTKPRGKSYRRGHGKHMTQDELHDCLSDVYRTGELPIPAFTVSALERGLVRIERFMIECVAAALSATDAERACLLEAGGYGGIGELIASTRGDLPLRFLAQLEKITEGGIKDADLAELIRLISAAMEIERQPPRPANPDVSASSGDGGSE